MWTPQAPLERLYLPINEKSCQQFCVFIKTTVRAPDLLV
jgi:hypothetical protein